MDQTKLKYSLAKKKNSVNKLKCILATPFPKYWPKIDPTDEESLHQLLFNDKKDLTPKQYFCSRGIKLGLGSCLRLIKNSSISCVLISTELKPSIVITQIINYCLVKNRFIKILLVPNLKNITKSLFDIESLTITCLKGKFPELEKWIQSKAENLPIPEKFLEYFTKNPPAESESKRGNAVKNLEKFEVNFNTLYVLKSNGPFLPENSKYLKPVEIDEKWTDNYISFSGADLKTNLDSDKIEKKNLYNYKTDRAKLLNIITEKLTSSSTKIENVKMDIDETESEKSNEDYDIGKIIIDLNKSKNKNNNKVKHSLINAIKYTPLKVNKIKGNPNKKKRSKKNKKKK